MRWFSFLIVVLMSMALSGCAHRAISPNLMSMATPGLMTYGTDSASGWVMTPTTFQIGVGETFPFRGEAYFYPSEEDGFLTVIAFPEAKHPARNSTMSCANKYGGNSRSGLLSGPHPSYIEMKVPRRSYINVAGCGKFEAKQVTGNPNKLIIRLHSSERCP